MKIGSWQEKPTCARTGEVYRHPVHLHRLACTFDFLIRAFHTGRNPTKTVAEKTQITDRELAPQRRFHFLHTQLTIRDAASEIQAEPFTHLTIRHRVQFRRAWQKGILNFMAVPFGTKIPETSVEQFLSGTKK